MGGERIEQGVDRLVGNRFAFVAASLENEGVRLAPQPLDEMVNEACLSHAGFAIDVNVNSHAPAAIAIGAAERLELVGAPDERPGDTRRRRGANVAARCGPET